jgi:hypothetical protein
MIRNMIMGMPGKLDHASAVAYCVGKWPGTQAPAPKIPQDCVEKIENNRNTAQNNKEETTSSSSPATEILLQSEEDIKSSPKKNDDDDFEGIDSSGSGHSETADEPMASAVAAAPPPIPLHLPQHQTEEKEEEEPNNEAKTIVGIKSNMNLDLKNQLASNGSPSEDQSPTEAEGLRSPYEDVPVCYHYLYTYNLTFIEISKLQILGFNSNESPRRVLLETEAIGSANRVRPSSSKKRHSRGSQARHTLGMDINFFLPIPMHIYCFSDDN